MNALEPRIREHIERLNRPLSEDEGALQFAAEYGDQLRFCHSRGAWLKWDGAIWRQDRTRLAFHFARELARRLAKPADARTILTAGRAAFAAGVERLARADPIFARAAADWDADPWLAGCPHGLLDLRTGRVAPPDPTKGITQSLAIAPADRSECPLWRIFLGQTFGGDADLIRFVQQWLGYALTGDVSENALVFGYGAGGNGKSVLLNTAMRILRDYATPAAMDTFVAHRGDRHPTELATLAGARFVTASETEEGRPWAEAKIKLLTGGDPVKARFMRQDFFEFRPTFKLFIVGNHRPELHSVDDAMRRRVNIVPFDHRPANPDRQLEAKLLDELPGILRWMIEGCLDWQANGLVRPERVIAETETYFSDQDLLGQWLQDRCDAEPGNDHKMEASGKLFASWSAYAERHGERPGNTKSFAEHMRRRGFELRKGGKGVRQYRGVELLVTDTNHGD